jgi:hypothetical protein
MPLTSRRFASSHNISKGCQGDSGFRGNSNSRVWFGLLRIAGACQPMTESQYTRPS